MTFDTDYLTGPEAAKLLGLKTQSLRKWRLLGRGPRYSRTGDSPRARVLYRRSDLEDWLAQRTFTSTAEEIARLDRKEAAKQEGGAA
jgi:predicted DNA-binding transcriptional regulator AlpA